MTTTTKDSDGDEPMEWITSWEYERIPVTGTTTAMSNDEPPLLPPSVSPSHYEKDNNHNDEKEDKEEGKEGHQESSIIGPVVDESMDLIMMMDDDAMMTADSTTITNIHDDHPHLEDDVHPLPLLSSSSHEDHHFDDDIIHHSPSLPEFSIFWTRANGSHEDFTSEQLQVMFGVPSSSLFMSAGDNDQKKDNYERDSDYDEMMMVEDDDADVDEDSIMAPFQNDEEGLLPALLNHSLDVVEEEEEDDIGRRRHRHSSSYRVRSPKRGGNRDQSPKKTLHSNPLMNSSVGTHTTVDLMDDDFDATTASALAWDEFDYEDGDDYDKQQQQHSYDRHSPMNLNPDWLERQQDLLQEVLLTKPKDHHPLPHPTDDQKAVLQQVKAATTDKKVVVPITTTPASVAPVNDNGQEQDDDMDMILRRQQEIFLQMRDQEDDQQHQQQQQHPHQLRPSKSRRRHQQHDLSIMVPPFASPISVMSQGTFHCPGSPPHSSSSHLSFMPSSPPHSSSSSPSSPVSSSTMIPSHQDEYTMMVAQWTQTKLLDRQHDMLRESMKRSLETRQALHIKPTALPDYNHEHLAKVLQEIESSSHKIQQTYYLRRQQQLREEQRLLRQQEEELQLLQQEEQQQHEAKKEQEQVLTPEQGLSA